MSRSRIQLNPGLNQLAKDTPFKWYSSTALFQPPLPEPDGPVSRHPALQAWDLVCLDCLSPYGSRPPAHSRGRSHSPAALHPVLGITPGIRLLRPLCHHAGRPVKVIPSSHVIAGSSLGSLFVGFPTPFVGSRDVVSSTRSILLRLEHPAGPIVPCVSLAWNIPKITQLGFGQSSPYLRRPSWPTRLRYLSRSALLAACFCPLPPFGARLAVALATLTPVGRTLATSDDAPQWRTDTGISLPARRQVAPKGYCRQP